MIGEPLPWQHMLIIAIAEHVIETITSAGHFDAWGFRTIGDMLRRHAQQEAERAFTFAVMP